MAADKLGAKIRNDFEAGEEVVNYAHSLNQQLMKRVEMLSAGSARRKIAALLDFLAQKAGKREQLCRIDIPLTTKEIANMCGLTRETASAQLTQLRREGVISGSRFLNINLPKLKNIL